MSEEADVVFTADQTAAASTALRTALGLPPEHFTVGQFIGMSSDEIEGLRAQGWTDTAIAALVSESTGSPINPSSIAEHFVTSASRRPPER